MYTTKRTNIKKCWKPFKFENVLRKNDFWFSSIQLFLLRKVVRQNGTNATSFCLQFEKVGCGLLKERGKIRKNRS